MLIFLCGLALAALIGGMIGSKKGKTGEGAFWGATLGPIGWLISFGSSDNNPCPHCKSHVNKGATKCCHCGGDIENYDIPKYNLTSLVKPIKPQTPQLRKFNCPYCKQKMEADVNNDIYVIMPCPNCRGKFSVFNAILNRDRKW